MDSPNKLTRKRLMADLSQMREQVADLERKVVECSRTEDAIQASEVRYRWLFESVRDGILILDASTGKITDINPFLLELLGYTREELLGRTLWELGPPREVQSSRIIFEKLLGNGHIHAADLLLRTKSGRCFKAEVVGNFYPMDGKKVIQCNIRDISGRSRAKEKIRYLITHDELTGLHNRMFFEEELSRISRGRQFPITIIIADVDDLKDTNDRLGHAAGDELLRRAASVLRETFRADEVVARIGGDEFVVMLPKTDAATAEMALDRARNKLHSHNTTQMGSPLSFSLGAATARASQSLVEALKQADEKMCEEKAAHKLEGLNRMPRDLKLIFKQIDLKLSATPGMHISRLASELACERHVIERAVRAAKSMQFREYQQMRRLETALHLLAERPLLIKEIAGALGYASPTSLWRLFKTRIGRSPSNSRVLQNRKITSSLESPCR